MAEFLHHSSDAHNGRVSVIIPAFNAAATIGRAIDSVLLQQVPDTELIVIDDGSTDGTVAAVSEHIRGIDNARLIRMANNSGVSAARNAGIAVAQGEFLAFLDADDIWLAGKLAKQLATIRQDPAIVLVSCNSQMIGPDGSAIKEGHHKRAPVQGADAWKTLLVYNFIPTPTVLTRTALVKASGGFDEALAVGEDLDLWIKLGTRGKIVVLDDILIRYYDMAGSLMKRHNGREAGIVTPMLERHIVEQQQRLTPAESRRIRGRQSFELACDLFFSGNNRACVPVFLKAAMFGTRPLKSLLYIPRAVVKELLYTRRKRR
jgi:glycosyltransferase involved in cell wall biosynthesis